LSVAMNDMTKRVGGILSMEKIYEQQ
jgi:hypothetical protein